MGGGGGDGDGERACLDDFGLALREVEGEPSGFDFGSGLFVSLEEASPESLSVAADFGLKAESAEEGEGGFTIWGWRRVAQLWECLCRTVFTLGGGHQARSGAAAWWQGRREAGGGEGRKWPNKEGSDDACPFPLYFFSSPTLSKPSVLRYFVPSSPFRRSHLLGIPLPPSDFAEI